MFGGVYDGRRVFVTGHTGFKGSWLTQWLLDLGSQVTGYSLEPPSKPNMYEVVGIGRHDSLRVNNKVGKFTDLHGDIRDTARLQGALVEADPEIVFHLAAQPLVRRSYVEPYLTFETNVMGTVSLLEAIRKTSTRPVAIVNVTTDKCYENEETGRAYDEGHPLGGSDPYSASKGCSELVSSAYRRSFFSSCKSPRLATARAGNVIGGGDWGDDRLLPDCARALSEGTPVRVRNPRAIRPWQHVLDALSGYLLLGARLWRTGTETLAQGAAFDGAWNFGPGPGANLAVHEVVTLFVEAWGEGQWQPDPATEPGPFEASLLLLDARKAERLLGWQPAWSAREAILSASRWYRAFYSDASSEQLLELCRRDIREYCAAAIHARMAWSDARDWV